jgi:hypothetical protein
MAFPNYTCVDDVVKKQRLTYIQDRLMPPDKTAPPSDAFRAELEFNMRMLPVGRSETGTGEVLLFPILREVWKPYVKELALFIHDQPDPNISVPRRPAAGCDHRSRTAVRDHERVESVCVTAVPLFSINTVDDVLTLMASLRGCTQC